jgi:hypothetical protein
MAHNWGLSLLRNTVLKNFFLITFGGYMQLFSKKKKDKNIDGK